MSDVKAFRMVPTDIESLLNPVKIEGRIWPYANYYQQVSQLYDVVGKKLFTRNFGSAPFGGGVLRAVLRLDDSMVLTEGPRIVYPHSLVFQNDSNPVNLANIGSVSRKTMEDYSTAPDSSHILYLNKPGIKKHKADIIAFFNQIDSELD